MNYRTKFIIDNIGISIESYKLNLDDFVSIIMQVIR